MTTIDKHPGDTEEEPRAYEEGWTAYHRDLDRTDNPYPEGREETSFNHWDRGWTDALEEEEEIER
jgi:hypothetical protein